MITQKIDRDDDILGVYHEWAREIAKSFDKLSVICLYEGRNELPGAIRVFSLGKEKGGFRAHYLKNFLTYIWRLRNDYDAVFVHMNPIYVLLGWPLWVLTRKKIFLFYAHYKTSALLRVSSFFCRNILTSVPESCGLKSKKVIAIGQGVDTSRFFYDGSMRNMRNLLFVGRISPVKKLTVLLDALALLASEENGITLTIVGEGDLGSEKYLALVHKKIKDYHLTGKVFFAGKVPNYGMPKFYNSHSMLINLTETGSFDKTILEAMSSQCLPVVCNKAYENIFQKDFRDLLLFQQDDAGDLARKIKKVIALSQEERNAISKNLRDIVLRNHSLFTLGSRLRKVMSM